MTYGWAHGVFVKSRVSSYPCLSGRWGQGWGLGLSTCYNELLSVGLDEGLVLRPASSWSKLWRSRRTSSRREFNSWGVRGRAGACGGRHQKVEEEATGEGSAGAPHSDPGRLHRPFLRICTSHLSWAALILFHIFSPGMIRTLKVVKDLSLIVVSASKSISVSFSSLNSLLLGFILVSITVSCLIRDSFQSAVGCFWTFRKNEISSNLSEERNPKIDEIHEQ